MQLVTDSPPPQVEIAGLTKTLIQGLSQGRVLELGSKAGRKNWSRSGRLCGGAKESHDAAAAERVGAGLGGAGGARAGVGAVARGAPEKAALAWWVRHRTTVPLRWVGERLDMGHSSRVAQVVSRMRRRPGRKLEKLRRKLAQSLKAES